MNSVASFEIQYLNLLRDVLAHGTPQSNRTGVNAISLHGAFIRTDLTHGFPAVTTRKLAFKAAIGELVGFLRANDSAAQFRELGCNFWNQNANENMAWLASPYRAGIDAMGKVYGVQWRRWPAFKTLDIETAAGRAQEEDALSKGYRRVNVVEGITEDGKTRTAILFKEVDQVRDCLDAIVRDPTDRRILFHGWNPAELDEGCLSPCHILYSFAVNVASKEISLSVSMRSTDLALGLPFNACTSAALLTLVSHLTGYIAKWLSISMSDAHIYETALPMVQEQLTREPRIPPRLVLSRRIPSLRETGIYEPAWLDRIHPSDFSLEGYEHHAALTALMAV
jgi:thymidylate synthase